MRRRDLEFNVGDLVYLKILPIKKVKRFGQKGNLTPCYVGLYRILSHFWKVSYDLDLPTDLTSIHPVFHVSLLHKCIGDSAYVVPL